MKKVLLFLILVALAIHIQHSHVNGSEAKRELKKECKEKSSTLSSIKRIDSLMFEARENSSIRAWGDRMAFIKAPHTN